MCVCVRACVRACVRVCVCVCIYTGRGGLEGSGFESQCRQEEGAHSHRVETWTISITLYRLPLPTRTGQRGANTIMQSTPKPWPPVPSDTERVHDQGGSSGQRAGGAKNLWVKWSHQNRVSKLRVATYNIRTLLRDEHIQELEEERRETVLVWYLRSVTHSVSLPYKAATYYTSLRHPMAKQE